MSKDGKLIQNDNVSFYDMDSCQYIHDDQFQKLEFPQEYPAFIQIHREHPAQSVPLHWHPGSELIYSRNREITITIDAKKVVVRPGEFALISSYALHSVLPSPSDERQDVMSISFQVSYLERMWPDLRDLVIGLEAPGATAEAVRNMKLLCEQLRTQIGMSDNTNTRNFLTNQLLYTILQHMYSDFLVGKRPKNQRRDETYSKLVDILGYLDKHFLENLTTQSVADEFGYTREYFCRLFKRYSNQTFKQYLTELRLSAAVQELRMTDRPVGQIAMDNGFPDEKSFFAAFKKKFDTTPSQYRATQNQ